TADRHCREPPDIHAASVHATHRAAPVVPPGHGASTKASWLGLRLGSLCRSRSHGWLGFALRFTGSRPVGKGPRLDLAVEGPEAANLRQVLAQAVAKIHDAALGRALYQPETQLDQHHAE